MSSTQVLNVAYNWDDPDSDGSLLSNFHPRRFEFEGKIYSSVEQAYQSLKSGEFDDNTFLKYKKMYDLNLPICKIKGKEFKSSTYAIELITKLVQTSLEQNPEVWAVLGKYDFVTHIVKKNGIIIPPSIVDCAFINVLCYMLRRWKGEN